MSAKPKALVYTCRVAGEDLDRVRKIVGHHVCGGRIATRAEVLQHFDGVLRAYLGSIGAEYDEEEKAKRLAKLSPAQRRLLDSIPQEGLRPIWSADRNAGRESAAWYRTAQSLEAMGLIKLVREGDGYRALLTSKGGAE